MTRVAMGAGQPTTLDGRMAVLAPGGRHPCSTYSPRNGPKPSVTHIGKHP
ncbi:MAG TPA: hypothetical protein VE955_03120 [Candidatus Dormibacteraeota bacterium]|nr:hypothetical protein [Candidatus Dormibacteraeota bacterium]